jgi:hypothetical protein
MELEPIVTAEDLIGILQVPNEALDRPNPLGAPSSFELFMGREIIVAAERRRRGMPPLPPLTYTQGEHTGTIKVDETAVNELLEQLTALADVI